MLRKVTTLLLTAGLLAGSAVAVSAEGAAKPAAVQANKISVQLNGRPLAFPEDPVYYQGATYVNASTLAVALKGTAAWDSNSKSVLIAKGENLALRIFINSSVAYKNGQKIKTPVQARPTTGAVLVPLVYIAQELGAKVTFNAKTKTYNLIIEDNI